MRAGLLQRNVVNPVFQAWYKIMQQKTALFSKTEMRDGFCKSLQVPDGHFSREIFVVFSHGQYFVYENHCPHTGSPLDWMPDQFLNLDKSMIQCATHNAMFRIDDGYCVSGPCAGQSLTPVDVTEHGGVIYLKIDGVE